MGYRSRRVITLRTLEGLLPRFNVNLYVRVRSNITMFLLYVYYTAAVLVRRYSSNCEKGRSLFYRHCCMKKKAPRYAYSTLIHAFFCRQGGSIQCERNHEKTCHCGGVGIKDVSFVVLFLRPQAARSIFVLHDGEAYSYYYCCTTAVLVSRAVGRVLGSAR